MEACWYDKIEHNHPEMVRADFCIARRYRRKLVRDHLISQALAEYFKTQRLHPEEIEEWDKFLSTDNPLDRDFVTKIKLAFAEGVLKDDLQTIDEDAFIGTCGQLLFQWIRAEFYGKEIIHTSPKLVTDSSKKQGIDYFEILGDPGDPSSLYFIVWEIKATDSQVASRTDEIYQMHKRRSGRLLRGLELSLSLEYPTDQYPVLGDFVRKLLDHWQNNTESKRIGGCVVFDTSNNPGEVFTTFHTHFSELNSSECRQVILIEIPKFKKMRKKLWTYLLTQMS
jgi:hypothetical protein